MLEEADISRLLEEGLRHYAVGEPSLALEAWYKVLAVDPAHARALEYVEYVRKSFRVEADMPALAPIGGAEAQETTEAEGTPQGPTDGREAEAAASSTDEAASSTDEAASSTDEGVVASSSQRPDAITADLAPTVSGDEVASPDDAPPVAVGVVASVDDVNRASIEASTDAAAPVEAGPVAAAASDAAHASASPSAEPAQPPAVQEETAPVAASAPSLAVDWGSLVDDGGPGGESGAPPSSASDERAPIESALVDSATIDSAPIEGALVERASVESATVDEAPAHDAGRPRSAIPPAITPDVIGPVDEPADPVVVAARWTTEASPAGAQDRADHGGFEDAPLPGLDDWPILGPGVGAIARATGPLDGPPMLGTDGPPPIDDSADPQPRDADDAGAPVSVHVDSSADAHDVVAAPAETSSARDDDATASDAVASIDDGRSPVAAAADAPEPESSTAPSTETESPSPSVTAADADVAAGATDDNVSVRAPAATQPDDSASAAKASALDSPRPTGPTTLLDSSWGDLIDDTVSARGDAEASPGERADEHASQEAPVEPATALPAMRLITVDERTPPSTRLSETEEAGPPPPSPTELASEDGSAPAIPLARDAASEVSRPDAEVIAFPSARAGAMPAAARSDDQAEVASVADDVDEGVVAAQAVVEQAPSTVEAAPVEAAPVEAAVGPLSEARPDIAAVDVAVVDVVTAAADGSLQDAREPELAGGSEPLVAPEMDREPLVTPAGPAPAWSISGEAAPVSETPPSAQATPASASARPAFKALAVEEPSDDSYVGVYRASKVSDSSIVVNPAEEAARRAPSSRRDSGEPRTGEGAAVVEDSPRRMLRFDSYEGDAVSTREGDPVDESRERSSSSDMAPVRPDLEGDDTMRVERPPIAASPPDASASVAEVPSAANTTSETFGRVPTTGPDGKPASPWDAFSGESDSVDLDTLPSRSVLDDLASDEERLSGGARRGRSADDARGRLDDFSSMPPAVSAPTSDPLGTAHDTEPVSQCAAMMSGARELFGLGDFSGSLELVEKVLKLEPDNLEARTYLERNEGTLLQMYISKLGDLRRAPRLLTSPDEVIWMNLHHRAGFLLSQVDGMMTYEDLAEISGMSRLETYRILADLVQNGVITS